MWVLSINAAYCSVYIAMYTATGLDPLISMFGINGNGLTRETRFIGSRFGGVNIVCRTNNPAGVSVAWYFSDGTQIGTENANLNVRSSPGMAVLQIAENRPLTYCDGGVFTCIADGTMSVGYVEEKNFTLIINS